MDVDVTSYVTETQKNKKIQNTKITKVIGEKKNQNTYHGQTYFSSLLL